MIYLSTYGFTFAFKFTHMFGVSKVHFVGTPYMQVKNFPDFMHQGAENIKANLSEHAHSDCV